MTVESIHEAFRTQASRTPEATAVRCSGRGLTYRELDERSDRLSARLTAAGAGPERPVIVYTDRSVDLVVALLATLKAGAFYLPLHPAYPAERMQWIADESDAPVLLADATTFARGLPQVPTTLLVDRPAPRAALADRRDAHRDRPHPDGLAYVMYTSGSTGAPKGVAVTHRNVLDLVADSIFSRPGAHERVLLATAYTFDPSTYAIWYPLLHGGTVVIATDAELTVAGLDALCAAERVTAAEIPSGLFRLIAEERPTCFRSFREVSTGGDVVSAAAVRRVLSACPGVIVRASYGPTETTLYATAGSWVAPHAVPDTVPLGVPLDGKRAYVLDATLAEVPDGEVGELYLAGAGLARGYLGRAALTAERFLADPYGRPGTRIYRTGDLARRTGGDALEFAGRSDDQVKIRGFRIEPGEVERALNGYPGIRESVVTVREDRPGDKRLVAYTVGAHVDAAAVRAYLAGVLPAYMVPAAVVAVSGLPLTPNHKIDYAALPAPDASPAVSAGPGVAAVLAAAAAPAVAAKPAAPAGSASESPETAWAVCGIASEILGQPVRPDDNLIALGADSLQLIRLVDRLRTVYGADVPMAAVFAASTVAALTAHVDRPSHRPALVAAHRPEFVPLSPAQYRLWFLSRLAGASTAYSLPIAVRLRGQLDVAALARALGDVVERHESLRTVIIEQDGEPYQVVLPAVDAVPALRPEHVTDLDAALRTAVGEPFDTATDIPLRARLFTTGPDEYALLITVNHIGTDGWSMRPLAGDLREAYGSRRSGHVPDWTPLPVQYADYTLWQRALLGAAEDPDSVTARQTTFWRTTLDGLPEEIALPADHPRPATATDRGAAVPLNLDADRHRAVAHLARASNSTVFMVLHAALAGLLTRLGSGPDIPIGTTTAGRGDAALEDLVGFFVNTLVLRTDTAGDPSFNELLSRVRVADVAAYEHQDLPFERVVEATNPMRSLARNPLFQVMLVLEPAGGYAFTLPGLDASTEELDTGTARFDLLFSFTERYAPDGAPAGISGRLEFSADLFEPATAALLSERFQALLAGALDDPSGRLFDIDLFGPGELAAIVAERHATGTPLPALNLPEQVQRQARLVPDAVAVRAPDGELTYAQLNDAGNRLAHVLLSRGVGPGAYVGVVLPRGTGLIVAFLAILKAGAAYLPVDPSYPRDRIDFILADAAPTVVLADPRTADRVPNSALVLGTPAVDALLASAPASDPTDADRPAPLTAETPSYVVYTSGSTGRPKGVVLPVRVLLNLLAWNASVFPAEHGSRVAQFSAVGFDASEHEILTALLNGKTLCIPDEDTRLNPDRLAAWLDAERITEFFAPDLVIGAVYEAAAAQHLTLASLRHVLQAGEALQLSPLVREFHATHPAVRLHNHYGPSETHVVTAATLPAAVADWPAAAPLGAPVWNTRLHLLDEQLRPVPVGVTAELYLAGDVVGHGYLNRPDLTAARFVADPYGPGRMYRSGDLARRRADGTLEFLGRADDQVKVRGIRVELGELNAVVADHPGIAHAATVLHEARPGDKRLVTYVVPVAGASMPPVEELRRHVAAAVPEALVPAAFVELDALPLTSNGKLDRRALPAPVYAGRAGRAPATPRETAMCALYADVLGAVEVGPEDDFFALGGHSLLATRLVNAVRAAFDVDLPVRAVFEAPTPAGLCRRLEEQRREHAYPGQPHSTRAALTPMVRPAEIPTSAGQQRLWFMSQLDGSSASYNLPITYRISGSVDAAALEEAFGDLEARHEVLRTVLCEIDGRPVQRILEPAPLPLHRVTTTAAGLAEAVRAATDHAFDLATERPIRTTLVTIAPDEHVLVVLFHHAACDAGSLGPLARDLSLAYAARLARTAPRWTPLPVQYADYALWQRELLTDGAAGLDYWTGQLAGLPTELALPTDRPRPANPTGRGNSFSVTLPARLHAALIALTRTTGTTLSMIGHTALAAVLTRFGTGTDIPIGTPIAGRTDHSLDDLIGFFVNTLVIRTDTGGDPTLGELLQRVRTASLAAYQHQDLPFDQIVEALNPPRTPGRNPLFQIMFEAGTAGGDELTLDSARVDMGTAILDAARFDLSLALQATVDGPGRPGPMRLDVGYATDLFDDVTVRGFVDRLIIVLEAVAAHPHTRLAHVDVLGVEERSRILALGTGPAPRPDASGVTSVQEAFRRQVERTPTAVAVRCAGRSLTYQELDVRSNRLARRLIAAGAGPEVPVAMLMDRTVDLLVAVTAILKTGGYYLPLHHASPLDRLQWVMEVSGAQILLTDDVMTRTGPGRPDAAVVILVDEEDGAAIDGATTDDTDPGVCGHRDQLAYVMYTSGSTGRPKGVAVTHGNVLDLVADSIFTPGDHDRVLLLTPYEFDPSTYSFWYPLLHGGTSVIAPEADLTVDRLARVMQEEQITGVDITAGLFRVMAEEHPECFAGVRVVITGGDIVSPTAVRSALEHCPDLVVRSNYGPTETTLFATSVPWRHAQDVPAPVPIGRPLDGMRTYVLDDTLQQVPAGVVGDLYIAGAGLARGYLNRPDLSTERFVADPFGPAGTRMYHTGDRVRWTAAGLLDFVGRTDGQVKIRGFRIELPEIEAVLAAFPTVRQAAVVAREDRPGDRMLAAYLVVDGELDRDALDLHVRASLPAYMMPAAVLTLPKLPLTANNKLDVRALPAPELGAQSVSRAPETEAEQRICDLFADVLGVAQVGAEDSFFDLGGHSLLSTRLISRIRAAFDVELPVRAVFESPSPAELCRRLEQLRPARPAVVPVPRGAEVGMSAAQQRLWFLGQFGDPTTYHMPVMFRLQGALNEAALSAAFTDLVARHEVLRTVLYEVDGRPVQRVQEPAPVVLHRASASQAGLTDVLDTVTGHAFDLSTEWPIRVTLVAVDDDTWTLVVLFHHIACDGLSVGPFTRDLATAYAARLTDTAPTWEPLPVQYADYALWQQHVLDDGGEQLDYWKRELADLPTELSYPTDRPRPTSPTGHGHAFALPLPAELHTALTTVARATGTTLSMIAHTALAALLTRLGAGTDIPIGTPIAGRTDENLDDLIGFFVNTLVIRTDTGGNPTLTELLHQVRTTSLAAYQHQDLPFDRLVETLNPPRQPGRNPLFQIMLQVMADSAAGLDLPGVRADTVLADRPTEMFDLSLDLVTTTDTTGTPGPMRLDVGFATDMFDESTVRPFADRFVAMLSAIAIDANVRMSDVDILDAAEREQILNGWNDTAVAPDRSGALVPALLSAQAALTPDAVALLDDDTTVTYAELDRRSNRLARLLIGRGVRPEDIVSVCVPRGPELIVALFGVLKSGAAYLPLDADYPAGRIAFMLEDSAPVCSVAAGVAAGHLGDTVPVVHLDDDAVTGELAGYSDAPVSDTDRNAPLFPGSPAYVIYTSGSTGRPKGTAIPHSAMLTQVRWVQSFFSLTPADRLIQFSSVSWDPHVEDIYPILINGGSLFVPRDPAGELYELLRRPAGAGLTVMGLPTAFWHELVAAGDAVSWPAGLRIVNVAGEAMRRRAVSQWLARFGDRVLLSNTYGPTEATVNATGIFLTHEYPSDPPIGRPVANTQVYVLDDTLTPTPTGVAGELYIAGHQLARGYLHQPDLTAQRFIANPHNPHTRMYRTGDLARWNHHGNLEYLGRTDNQLKIRGYRIEPGEIQAAITNHPDIHQATITTHTPNPGDHPQLIAYIVPTNPHTTHTLPDTIRQHLTTQLPTHLHPTHIITIPTIPLTPNGKLDTHALPPPTHTTTTPPRPPHNPQEHILTTLFAQTLNLPTTNPDDNFFDLGGHSLLATRLLTHIRNTFNTHITVRTIFEAPTPAELALRLDSTGRTRPALVAPASREVEVGMSAAQQRLWFLGQFTDTTTYNMPVMFRLRGALNEGALTDAFTDLVTRHEVLRTVLYEVDGRPVQRVQEPAPVVLHRATASRANLTDVLKAEAGHPFDLSTQWPIRVTLVAVDDDTWTLVVLFHHIACDGLSVGPFTHDLSTAYAARVSGTAPAWDPLPVQYADYALWQHDILDDGGEQLDYWKQELADLPVELTYPTDRRRPVNPTGHGHAFTLPLPAELHAALTAVGRATGTTLSMIAHGALAALLTRLGAGTDIPIGTPIAGRTDQNLDNLIGFFVNTLVLRTNTTNNPTFTELLHRVRTTSLAAYQHQDLPFDHLVEALNPPRQPGRNPLFQIMLQVGMADADGLVLEGVSVTEHEGERRTARFDLSLDLEASLDEHGRPGPMRLDVVYAQDLFDEATARRLMDRYVGVLSALAAAPDAHLSDVDVLDVDERAAVLALGVAPGPELLAAVHRILDDDGDEPITRVYVLDAQGALVPVGGAGELCLGSPDLAPELSTDDPYGGAGARMVRTGMQVLWTRDGGLLPLADAIPITQVASSAVFRAPGDATEARLCALFADVLGVPAVGVDDGFFALGGHSLLATWLVSKVRDEFGVELSVRQVFDTPTVAELATVVAVAGRARPAPVAKARPERIPMSYAQQRLWFVGQLEGASSAYNMPVSYRVRGRLDVPALQAAFSDVVARHEVLRTLLCEVDGEPVQVIRPAAPVALHRVDGSVDALPDILLRTAGYVFDLAAEPPMRVTLVALGPEDHVLVVLFHHSGSDGLSMGPFHRDLAAAYGARLAGHVPAWEALSVQYADYALWQREVLGTPDDPDSELSKQLTFWTQALAEAPTELDYPTDRRRPAVASQRGTAFVVDFGAQLHADLLDVARRTGTTLTMVAHAAVAGLLTRLGAGTDIPLGLPVGGRTDAALDDLVGFFINTLVLRVNTTGDPTFEELLARVRDTCVAAYSHQDVPFERVVEAVNPPRSASRNPLFQIMVQGGTDAGGGPQLPGVTLTDISSYQQMEKFDLAVNLVGTPAPDGRPGPLHALVRFACDLFDEPTMRRMVDRLGRVLQAMATDPTTRLSGVDLLDDEERRQILHDWNDTAMPHPTQTSVAEMFAARVVARPDDIAVVAGSVRLSYAQLDGWATRIARELSSRGVGPESVVALYLPRGAEMVAAILGTWRAGAAYLPLDPNHPAERIAYLLADCRAAAIVGPRAAVDLLGTDVPTIDLDNLDDLDGPDSLDVPSPAPLSGDNLAYVIYTSGSTGQPKGVAVTHGALVNYVAFTTGRVGLGAPGGRYALLQAQVTDLGNTILFASLATGGELHILDADDVTDPAAVAGYLAEHRIDYLKAVPSHLAALTVDGIAPVLPARSLVLGGEASSPDWARDVLAAAGHREVFNHYGPTETTIGATTTRITEDSIGHGGVSIGRPVANTQVYVLDDTLTPTPTGVAGELYIAGHQLARGYLHQPDLTAQRFIANPHNPHTRMYRTGDLARWNHHGNLEYLGRTDNQLKIRGYRIEPGEIQAAITNHPDIHQATITTHTPNPGDHPQLIAYIVPTNPHTTHTLPDTIRQHLTTQLPTHLHPTHIITIPTIPLTPNGKLDTHALPPPTHTTTTPPRPPHNPQEHILTTLFAQTLNLPTTNPDDNFFDLGGHSLLATRLLTHIRNTFNTHITVRTIFEAPTPARMARWLVTGGVDRAFEIVYPMRTEGHRLPLFCLHPGSGLAWVYSGLLRSLDPDIPLYGIQSVALRPGLRPASLTDMAREYVTHIRSVQPSGPYRLMGWSLGGVLAHEVAVQLQEAGERVTVVGILDTNAIVDEAAGRTPVPDEHMGLHVDDPASTAALIAEMSQHDVPILNALQPDEQARVVSAVNYHRQIRPRHLPRVFHGDALFVRATEDKDTIVPGADTWGRYITGEIRELRVPCTHYDLLAMAPLVGLGSARARNPLAAIGEALNKELAAD